MKKRRSRVLSRPRVTRSTRSRVLTKSIVIEVETSATNDVLKDRSLWEAAVALKDSAAQVRQVTVLAADRTKKKDR